MVAGVPENPSLNLCSFSPKSLVRQDAARRGRDLSPTEGAPASRAEGWWAPCPTSTKIGSVSRARYEEIVVEDRKLIEVELVPGRPESPVAPVVRQLDRTIDFLDLIGACHKFVAATGRLVPQMRGRRLSEDEREVNHKNVDRVRATFSELRTAA
ncbi:DUF6192 family protein [Streptomyces sp. 11x1]|uniref:DUF6192 family protein n=1 Tax=Streptomyces sp. 11x1 TaxID=3038642 RepID=UPI00292CA8CA|nr:DUF6192 family protein [Streptomyces sp. 11x1]